MDEIKVRVLDFHIEELINEYVSIYEKHMGVMPPRFYLLQSALYVLLSPEQFTRLNEQADTARQTRLQAMAMDDWVKVRNRLLDL